jgi:uracil-DNA glycosylase family 4
MADAVTEDMKQIAYRALVEERKSCARCAALGLTNPASPELSHLDSDQIGPWTRWQGDLNADVMVVAQGWGDVEGFKRQSGVDNESATNRMLIELLAHVGVRLTSPLASRKNSGVFLTNAVLCLKYGNAQTVVSKQWYANCGPRFLRRQIEIVRPRVVVTLGEWAYRTTMDSFGLEPRRFRYAVDSVDPVVLFHGTCLIPVYHCGRRILNTHRDREAQFKDWMRVRHALTGNIPAV